VYIAKCGDHKDVIRVAWNDLNTSQKVINLKAEALYADQLDTLNETFQKLHARSRATVPQVDDSWVECNGEILKISGKHRVKFENVIKRHTSVSFYGHTQFLESGRTSSLVPYFHVEIGSFVSGESVLMELEGLTGVQVRISVQDEVVEQSMFNGFALGFAVLLLAIPEEMFQKQFIVSILCLLLLFLIGRPEQLNVFIDNKRCDVMLEPMMNLEPTVTDVPAETSDADLDLLLEALRPNDDCLEGRSCSIPLKWKKAANGDLEAAALQWKTCLKWRRENDIDGILDRPHTHFETIKSNSVFLWTGHDDKQNLVAIQEFGSIAKDIKNLTEAGISPEEFAMHIVFLNEYWIKQRLSGTGKFVHIIDLKNFTLGMLSRAVVKYCSPMSFCMQQYPDLLAHAYIINTPSTFCFLWKIVSPFVAKQTLEKVEIVGSNPQEISKVLRHQIPENALPVSMGGSVTDIQNSKYEVDLRNFVNQLNELKM